MGFCGVADTHPRDAEHIRPHITAKLTAIFTKYVIFSQAWQ